MSEELPRGWATATVRALFDCWGGMTPSTSIDAYWGGSMPWVSSKDVKARFVDGGTECVTTKALTETRLRQCPPGAVLVVVRSGVLAHTLPVAITTRVVVVNQDVKALDSGSAQLNEWLSLYLRAHERDILEENRKDGTTVQSIRVEQLLDREMPIAPLREQRRIVEKVDALLDRVNRAKERLDRIPLILKRFRQGVLAAACSGKLTGVGDVFDGNLPADWVSQSFMDVFDIEGGTQPPKSTFIYAPRPGYVRLLQIRDFGKAPLPTYIPDDPRLRKCAEHDVLIGRYGASVGRICTGMAGAYNVALTRVVIPASVDHQFARLLLGSPLFQQPLVEIERSAQNGFNKGDLGRIELPFPPLSQQQDIVRRVDALSALADAIEARVVHGTAAIERLPRLILSKAFCGELVPTEAELARAEGRDYESASQLVERITQAAPQQPKSGRATRKAPSLPPLRSGRKRRRSSEPLTEEA